MWPRRIERRLGRCELIAVVSLGGYALRFHKRGRDGSGKCDAYRTGNPTDTLYGVVYSLTRVQQDMLDEFEGPGYASQNVSVRTRSDLLTAYAYVAHSEQVQADLQPFGWYKSIVLAGARAHALPAHYIESIAAVGSLPDPDPDRDSHHLAMLDGDVTGEANRSP
jgi:gamma-glutamylcyclotransferase